MNDSNVCPSSINSEGHVNVYGMSVTDWVNQRDVASNTVDSISQCPSENMLCAVRLSTCHLLDSQATSTQVSTHCITMSEVGGSTFQAQTLGFLPTSFYYINGGIMI